MKTIAHLVLLLALPVFILACEKENLVSEKMPAVKAAIIPNGCGWTPCDLAIAETKAQYQALANSLQDTVWVDITCCADGLETYALVIVVPKRPFTTTYQAASCDAAF